MVTSKRLLIFRPSPSAPTDTREARLLLALSCDGLVMTMAHDWDDTDNELSLNNQEGQPDGCVTVSVVHLQSAALAVASGGSSGRASAAGAWGSHQASTQASGSASSTTAAAASTAPPLSGAGAGLGSLFSSLPATAGAAAAHSPITPPQPILPSASTYVHSYTSAAGTAPNTPRAGTSHSPFAAAAVHSAGTALGAAGTGAGFIARSTTAATAARTNADRRSMLIGEPEEEEEEHAEDMMMPGLQPGTGSGMGAGNGPGSQGWLCITRLMLPSRAAAGRLVGLLEGVRQAQEAQQRSTSCRMIGF